MASRRSNKLKLTVGLDGLVARVLSGVHHDILGDLLDPMACLARKQKA